MYPHHTHTPNTNRHTPNHHDDLVLSGPLATCDHLTNQATEHPTTGNNNGCCSYPDYVRDRIDRVGVAQQRDVVRRDRHSAEVGEMRGGVRVQRVHAAVAVAAAAVASKFAPQHAVELRRGERELASSFIAGANDGGVRLLEVGTVIVPAHAEELQTSNLSSHLATSAFNEVKRTIDLLLRRLIVTTLQLHSFKNSSQREPS